MNNPNPKLFYPEEIIEAFKYAASKEVPQRVTIPKDSDNMFNASRISLALGWDVKMGFTNDSRLIPYFRIAKGNGHVYIYVKTWRRDSIEVEAYAE